METHLLLLQSTSFISRPHRHTHKSYTHPLPFIITTFTLIFISLDSIQQPSNGDQKVGPRRTPLSGPVQDRCRGASRRYLSLITETIKKKTGHSTSTLWRAYPLTSFSPCAHCSSQPTPSHRQDSGQVKKKALSPEEQENHMTGIVICVLAITCPLLFAQGT